MNFQGEPLHDEDCELHTGYEQEKVKPFQNSRNPRSRHQASNLKDLLSLIIRIESFVKETSQLNKVFEAMEKVGSMTILHANRIH